MKIRFPALLAILASVAAIAQEEGYKGNPHVVVPTNASRAAVPFDEQRITLPLPDSQITNLFSRGYQSMGDKAVFIRLSHRNAPEKIHAVKIGDFVGNYRIDRVSQPEEPFGIILVKSNETAIIRARQACETHKNEVVKGTPNLRRQNTSRPDP